MELALRAITSVGSGFIPKLVSLLDKRKDYMVGSSFLVAISKTNDVIFQSSETIISNPGSLRVFQNSAQDYLTTKNTKVFGSHLVEVQRYNNLFLLTSYYIGILFSREVQELANVTSAALKNNLDSVTQFQSAVVQVGKNFENIYFCIFIFIWILCFSGADKKLE